MSSEKPPKVDKKEKSEKKDKSSKKRKLEVTEDAPEVAEPERKAKKSKSKVNGDEAVVAKEDKKAKKEKKSKLAKDEDAVMADAEPVEAVKPKKEKKSKKSTPVEEPTPAHETVADPAEEPKPKKKKKSKKTKAAEEAVETAQAVAEEVKEDKPAKKEKKSKKKVDAIEEVKDVPADEVELKKQAEEAAPAEDALASNADIVKFANENPTGEPSKKKRLSKTKREKAIQAEVLEEILKEEPAPTKTQMRKDKKEKKAEAEELANGGVPINGDAEEAAVPTKSSKKDKKAKIEADTGVETVPTTNGESLETDPIEKKEKPKKEKKSKKSKTEDAEGGKPVASAADVEDADKVEPPAKKKGKKEGTPKNRFIAFVGNLPYDTTKIQLQEHFKKIPPMGIRMIQAKDTGKFKGFSFFEWETWDKLQTAFQLYHHTAFRPEIDGDKARQINVEITAGGGGNTEQRKTKIKVKNEKLDEDRARYAARKAEFEKAAEKAKEEGQGSIHPSRMARMAPH